MPTAPPPRPIVTPPVRKDTPQDWLQVGGVVINLAMVETVTLPDPGSPRPTATLDLTGGRTVIFEGADALAVGYFFGANATALKTGEPASEEPASGEPDGGEAGPTP